MKTFLFSILLSCMVSLTVFSQQKKDTIITVYFETGKFVLTNTVSKNLETFFNTHDSINIIGVSGYTDSVGSEKSNVQLSARRSNSVVAWLKKNASVNSSFDIKNFGESMPVSDHDNAMNRRVDIKVMLTFKNNGSTDTANAVILKKYNFDKLFFQPDKAVLESYSRSYVDEIAGILKTYQQARFEIRGHVNCPLNVDPNSEFMQAMNKLSVDRARAIYEMLIDRGIPADKMSYKGMGNTEMIYPNAADDDEKRKNMRVEILVLKK